MVTVTIGRLAEATGLTTRALRHYDRLGLVVPAGTDPATGTRLYDEAQRADVEVVGELRRLDVPLADVREVLGREGPARDEALRQVLHRHRERLEARRTRAERLRHAVDHALADGLPAAARPGADRRDDPPGVPGAAGGHGPAAALDDATHRRLAAGLFNATWDLLEAEERSAEDDDALLHRAHASAYHWSVVGGPHQRARGEWLCSRVAAVLHLPDAASHHAARCLALCEEHAIGDWDLAFAHEALARAAAVAGDDDAVGRHLADADAAAADVRDDGDRALVLADLATVPRPGQGVLPTPPHA